jgi:NADH:ubiquinone oxidoreductase subunit 6 (subunit J)
MITLSIVYIILLIFVLAIMYTKIRRKEKIESFWWRILVGMLALLILFLFIVGYMSPGSIIKLENIEISK